jgi:Cu(I)/Ag(I) efflux system membrane protein CusA/SilA
MKRIAAPMVGGILTSFALELLVYPAIYAVWRERTLATEGSVASPSPVIPDARTVEQTRIPLSLTR